MSVKAGQMFQLDQWTSFGRHITELNPTTNLRYRVKPTCNALGIYLFRCLVKLRQTIIKI